MGPRPAQSGVLGVFSMSSDRWNPCKPFLIGGHSWGSEHLKLFLHATKNRIEPVLAPGICQLAAQCGGGASGLSADLGIAQTIPEPSCTTRYTPWAADAQADAADDADAYSLGSPPLSVPTSPPTHTHSHSYPACTLHTRSPSLSTPATATSQHPTSYIVPTHGWHNR